MVIESVSGTDGINLIDTEMFDTEGFTAAYLFRSDKNLLIDAGLYQDGQTVELALEEAGISPGTLDYIAISHLHLDHAGGVTYLAEKFPEARILCHEITADYLTDSNKLRELFRSGQKAMSQFSEQYGEANALKENRINILRDGDLIDLGSRQIRVLEAPGHAPHQICFYDEANQALHLVDEGCARMNEILYPTTPPPDFNLEKTLTSLDRFIDLKPDKLLYSHFGYSNNAVDNLKEHYGILQDWVATVKQLSKEDSDPAVLTGQVIEELGEDIPDFYQPIIERDVRGVFQYLY